MIFFHGCSASLENRNIEYYSEFVELYISEVEKSGSEEEINEYKEMSLKYYDIIKDSMKFHKYSKEQIEEFNEITEKFKSYNILSIK